jgi:hypothetical protein
LNSQRDQEHLMKLKHRSIPWVSAAAFAVAAPGLVAGPAGYERSGASGLGVEQVPAGEAQTIENLVKLQSAIQIQKGKVEKREQPRRGQHGKAHGCVEAELRVPEDLPESARHGFFANPGTYRATVRFSNGGKDDDRKPDVRGMAIKVHDVPGPKALDQGPEEQDFVLMDSPAFFAPDVASVLALMQAAAADARTGTKDATTALAADRPMLVERLAASLKTGLSSPLAGSYWSTVPYRFGDSAAKFAARPASTEAAAGDTPDDPGYLRRAMASRLADGTAELDLLAQLQKDAAKQPIEDPTVLWSETESPEIKVATLIIPSQRFDSPEQLSECDSMVFSPWHALKSHEPLGGINRARRAVYEASAGIRE